MSSSRNEKSPANAKPDGELESRLNNLLREYQARFHEAFPFRALPTMDAETLLSFVEECLRKDDTAKGIRFDHLISEYRDRFHTGYPMYEIPQMTLDEHIANIEKRLLENDPIRLEPYTEEMRKKGIVF